MAVNQRRRWSLVLPVVLLAGCGLPVVLLAGCGAERSELIYRMEDGNARDAQNDDALHDAAPPAQDVVALPDGETHDHFPTAPPVTICDNAVLLAGPATAPAEAIQVAAGDNSGVDFGTAGATYWFAPGVHTLGSEKGSQIIPGNGATFVGAPGAVIDGRHINAFAFTQRAEDVHISHLEIRNFLAALNEGVVNHDGGAGWVMEYNNVHDNGGAGVFVSSNNILRYNCLRDNEQYGFQGFDPAPGATGFNLVIDHNEIAHNAVGDAEQVEGGCGCTGGGRFWDVNGATVTNNWVHDNLSAGLWADTNNRNFVFEGNYVENNDAEALFYELSYNAQIRNNTFRRNTLSKGSDFARRGDNFPVAAVYISDAGGDERVPGTPTVEISGNYFEDNWSGVTLWEDANRFCGSPDNQSKDYCTLVNAAATLSTCARPGIATKPLYDDCRWKTQNVTVHDNEFHVTPANIGCTNELCARQAILSIPGTSPSWSPYLGQVVEDAITLQQNNRFYDNRYWGPWRFMVRDTSVEIDFAGWRAAPYEQDQGSSLE